MDIIARMQTVRFQGVSRPRRRFEESGAITARRPDREAHRHLISATRYALMMRRYARWERTEQRRLRLIPGGGGAGLADGMGTSEE